MKKLILIIPHSKVPSPIAAFAAVGAYNVLFYVIYLSGYMITLTYAP